MNRVEQARRTELFKEALGDFQYLAINAELSRDDPGSVSHGRNLVIWGWIAFADALEAYSLMEGRLRTFGDSGVEEVVKALTEGKKPDRLLAMNAHYLLQHFTFNDLEHPGIFLRGLDTEDLQRAMSFCKEIFPVGMYKNDIDKYWPILSLDEELWSLLTEADREFIKTFSSFNLIWGGVPRVAIDNFPKSKRVQTEKQLRYLLTKMEDIGLVVKKPLEEDAVYECSKENYSFLGLT